MPRTGACTCAHAFTAPNTRGNRQSDNATQRWRHPLIGSDVEATIDEAVARDAQQTALAEQEQWILGFQLRGGASAIDVASNELRSEAKFFLPPHNRIQSAILRAYDAGEAISAAVIAAELAEYAPLIKIGGIGYCSKPILPEGMFLKLVEMSGRT